MFVADSFVWLSDFALVFYMQMKGRNNNVTAVVESQNGGREPNDYAL